MHERGIANRNCIVLNLMISQSAMNLNDNSSLCVYMCAPRVRVPRVLLVFLHNNHRHCVCSFPSSKDLFAQLRIKVLTLLLLSYFAKVSRDCPLCMISLWVFAAQGRSRMRSTDQFAIFSPRTRFGLCQFARSGGRTRSHPRRRDRPSDRGHFDAGTHAHAPRLLLYDRFVHRCRV